MGLPSPSHHIDLAALWRLDDFDARGESVAQFFGMRDDEDASKVVLEGFGGSLLQV
jgi:hypothetical protein